MNTSPLVRTIEIAWNISRARSGYRFPLRADPTDKGESMTTSILLGAQDLPVLIGGDFALLSLTRFGIDAGFLHRPLFAAALWALLTLAKPTPP